MNNLMQKILIDSAIEYSKNLLLSNNNPDLCLGDLDNEIFNLLKNINSEDLINAIKNKCKSDNTKKIIDSLNNMDDSKCHCFLMILMVLFTEDTRINNLLCDVDERTALMLFSILKGFRNLQEFIIYFDSSYINIYNNSIKEQQNYYKEKEV